MDETIVLTALVYDPDGVLLLKTEGTILQLAGKLSPGGRWVQVTPEQAAAFEVPFEPCDPIV